MSQTIRIAPGQVWVTRMPTTRTPSRRVVATVDRRICYSAGGETTRWCQARAFRFWIARYQAKATRTRRPRRLTLRKEQGA